MVTGWIAEVKTLENRFRACLAIGEEDRDASAESSEVGELGETFFQASYEDIPHRGIRILSVVIQRQNAP